MTDRPFNPADIAQAFKFEPGDHEYLVEVKADAGISKADLEGLMKAFKEANVKVSFAMTYGDGFQLHPVEGTKK